MPAIAKFQQLEATKEGLLSDPVSTIGPLTLLFLPPSLPEVAYPYAQAHCFLGQVSPSFFMPHPPLFGLALSSSPGDQTEFEGLPEYQIFLVAHLFR